MEPAAIEDDLAGAESATPAYRQVAAGIEIGVAAVVVGIVERDSSESAGQRSTGSRRHIVDDADLHAIGPSQLIGSAHKVQSRRAILDVGISATT